MLFAIESINREASQSRKIWNVAIAVLIMYSVVVLPFRLGFEQAADGWFFYAEVVAIDVLFLVDMIINFFSHREGPADDGIHTSARMSQLSKTTAGRRMAASLARDAFDEEEAMVPWRPFACRSTCMRDAWTYTRTWFIVDFFSTMPFDLILLAFLGGTSSGLRGLKLVRTLRLARLLKLVRVFKLRKVMSTMTSPSTNLVATAMVRLGKIIGFIFLAAHILSCVFHYLSLLETDGDAGPAPTWLDSVRKPDLDTTDLGTRYLLSLYWVVATLMAVGFGDIHAITAMERGYSIFTQLVGVICFGIIVAQVAQLLETINARSSALSRRMDEVREYMLDRKLPQSMQRKILDYFDHYYSQKSLFNESEILSSLSKSLRNELVAHGMGPAINSLSAIKSEDPSLLSKLVTRFKPALHMPGDMIAEEGDIGREVFFLTKGVVDVIAELPDDFVVLPDFTVQPLVKLDEGAVKEAMSIMTTSKAKSVAKTYEATKRSRASIAGRGGARARGAAGSGTLPRSFSKHNLDGSTDVASQVSIRTIGSCASMQNQVPLPQPCLLLGMYTEGRHFGDVSVLLEVRRPVGYRASVRCSLQALSKQDLEIILYDYPEAYRRLRAIAEQRSTLLARAKRLQIEQARDTGLREVCPAMPHIHEANERARSLYFQRKAQADAEQVEANRSLARRAKAIAQSFGTSSRNIASSIRRRASFGTKKGSSAQVAPMPLSAAQDAPGPVDADMSSMPAPRHSTSEQFGGETKQSANSSGKASSSLPSSSRHRAGQSVPTMLDEKRSARVELATPSSDGRVPPAGGHVAGWSPGSTSSRARDVDTMCNSSRDPVSSSPHGDAGAAADQPGTGIPDAKKPPSDDGASEAEKTGAKEEERQSDNEVEKAEAKEMEHEEADEDDGAYEMHEEVALRLADATKLKNVDAEESAAAADGVMRMLSQAKMVLIPVGGTANKASEAPFRPYPDSGIGGATAPASDVSGDDPEAASVSTAPDAEAGDVVPGLAPSTGVTVLLDDAFVSEEELPAGIGGAVSHAKGLVKLRVVAKNDAGVHEKMAVSQSELRRRFVLHAGDPIRMRYDMMMAVLILVTLVEVPFVIGFAVDESIGLRAFDSLVDAAFIVDLISSFRSAFRIEDSDDLNIDGWDMAVNYLRTNFAIDFLSTVPFDTAISAAIGDSHGAELRTLKLLRTVRLVRLLKLFRFFRLRRLVQRLQLHMIVPPAILQLARVGLQVALGAHVLACVFFFVSIAGTNDRTEAAREAHWWTATTPNELGQQYLAALYFASTTMTTVGYGDLVPQTIAEIIVTVFAMLIGATVFGYIVGSVAHLVARLDSSGMRYQAKMSELLEYLHDKATPKSLARRVIRYYDYYLSRKSAFDEDVILDELSDTLRREVVLYINMDIIRRVPYFFYKDREFVTLLVSLLRPQFVYPGTMLYREGEMATEMFFLIKGQVEIVAHANTPEEHRYALLDPGSYFGELALLMGIRRSSSARALSHANLFVLTKDDLRSTVVYYPQLAEKMEESLRTTLDKLTKGSLGAEAAREKRKAKTIAATFVSTLMKDVQSNEMTALASHHSRTGIDAEVCIPGSSSMQPGEAVLFHAGGGVIRGDDTTLPIPESRSNESAVEQAVREEFATRSPRSAGDDDEISAVTGERGTIGLGVAGDEWKADIHRYLHERAASLGPSAAGDAFGVANRGLVEGTSQAGSGSVTSRASSAGEVVAGSLEPVHGAEIDTRRLSRGSDEMPAGTRKRRTSVELSMAMRDVANLPTLVEEDDEGQRSRGVSHPASRVPVYTLQGTAAAAISSSAGPGRTTVADRVSDGESFGQAGDFDFQRPLVHKHPGTFRESLTERAASTEAAATIAPLLLAPGLRPDQFAMNFGSALHSKRMSMPPQLQHPARRRDTDVAVDPLPSAELQRLLRLASASDGAELIGVPAATLASLLVASQAPSEIGNEADSVFGMSEK